jgi:hypothetical protein
MFSHISRPAVATAVYHCGERTDGRGWSMRCPAGHTDTDPPAEVALVTEWATATSWANVYEGLLAEGRCPACPAIELEPFTTILYSRERTTGRCPCCRAVWLTDDDHGWTALDTGRLT